MRTAEHLTDARERLAAAVEQMADSDTFAAFLRARAAFRDYSWSNVALIVSQRPNATRVAGFRKWQTEFGRNVRRGERAIKILAPCVAKFEDKQTGEQVRRVVSFRAVNVFDVLQTEGPPLPELEYRPLEGEAPDLADFLCGVAMAAGLEIRREQLSGGVHGYLRRSEGLIVVETACSGAMAAKVVAHELGHFFDPFLTEHPEAYAAHRGDCEAVAESVAFVVCSAYQVDAGPSAVGYCAAWLDKNASRVRDLAERIDHAARCILDGEETSK